jgi:chromate transporter
MIAALLALNLIDRKLFSLAALMMKIDLFAFGGGFASIPLMLHEVVGVRRWMDNRTFMDGIVLGQVTPGPIVITSTFVGYLTHRIAGALVATAAIFTPSFFMVIVLSPIMDKLKSSAYFLKATKGIVASFVGLLLFVTFKFSSAVHWDILKAFLGLLVLIALLKKVDMVYVVLASAVLSVFLF